MSVRTGGGADVLTIGGTITAGRDALIQTDQGADQMTTSARILAGRNLAIEAGGGSDSLVFGAALVTTTGTLTVDLMLGNETTSPPSPNRQTLTMTSGGMTAGTHLLLNASGTVGADITLLANATAGDNLTFQTDRGADIVTITANVQADNVVMSLGANNDRLAVTGIVTSTGGTDSTTSSSATYGDITFDFGNDADAVDTLILVGSLNAKRDLRVLKLPETTYSIDLGSSFTKKVFKNDTVTLNSSSGAMIYRYIGLAAATVDLNDTSIYTNKATWLAVDNFSENSGYLTANLSGKGSVVAGRDMLVWTGGGEDLWNTVGTMTVDRNIMFRMDRGLDRFITTADIVTETGYIAFQMGDSPATDRGPFAPKDAEPQQVIFDKKAVVTAGTDFVVSSKAQGDFVLLATGAVSAGRDISIQSEDGRDLYTFVQTLTAGRNLLAQSGIETDKFIVGKGIEATDGWIKVDLDIGNERDLSLPQVFEVTEGPITAGTSLLITATGKSPVEITATGPVTTGTSATISTGSANDTLSFTGAVSIGTDLSVFTSAGADSVLFDGTVTTGGLTLINLGSGPASASSGGASVQDILYVTDDLTAGTSISLIKTGTNSASITLDGKLVAGSSIQASMGGGDDVLLFNDTVTAGTELSVATGGGVDSATFVKALRSIGGDMLFDFGQVTANRSLLVLSDTVRSGGDLTLTNTGAGGLTATIAMAVTVTGDITIDTGDGYDVIDSKAVVTSGGDLTITMDGGGDAIRVASTASFVAEGDVSINMGDFDGIADEVALGGAVTAGGAMHLSNKGSGGTAFKLDGANLTVGKGGLFIDFGDSSDSASLTNTTITSAGGITMDLGAGDDVLQIKNTVLTAAGDLTLRFGAGDDTVTVQGATLSAEREIFDLADGDDVVVLTDLAALHGAASILGGAGADTIAIIRLPSQQSGDTLTIDGGQGADTVVIQTFGSLSGVGITYDIAVRDTASGKSAADTLDIRGTDDPDLFLVRDGAVALRHGTFVQLEDGTLTGGQERILYDSAQEGLWLRSFGGADFVALDDTSTATLVDSGAGNDYLRVGQVYAEKPAVSLSQGGVTLSGVATRAVSGGWLSEGVSHTTLLSAGDEDDRIEVNANLGDIKIEADAGNDAVTVRSFAAADGSGALMNGTVSIAGGVGSDSVSVRGTDGSDTYLVEAALMRGAGRSIALSASTEIIRLDAGAGNDTVNVNATLANTYTEILGGLGSDRMSVGAAVTGLRASGAEAPAAVTVEVTEDAAWFVANRGPAAVTTLAVTALSVEGPRKLEAIDGALRFDGAGQTADAFGRPLTMADETVARGVTVSVGDDTLALDRLTLRSDAGNTQSGALNTVTLSGRVFQQITGLDQPDNGVTIQTASGALTQAKGIFATAVEVTEILLGAGKDSFAFGNLAQSSDNVTATQLVVLQAGGGDDAINALSVLGQQALVLYGDGERGETAYGATKPVGVDTFDLSKQASGVILVDGGAGNDSILGGAGTLVALGGEGADTLQGAAGASILVGDATLLLDRATATVRIDTATSTGNDRLTGGTGTQILVGDSLVSDSFAVATVRPLSLASTGVGGADIISAVNTAAIILAGGGSDIVTAVGAQIIMGDTGTVTLSAAGRVLRAVSDGAAGGGVDTITLAAAGGVVVGGDGADVISATGGINVLVGDDGDITFAATGADRVESIWSTRSGADTITGGAGRDVILGGGGADVITTGEGDNIAFGDHGILSGLAAHIAASLTLPKEGGSLVILAAASDDSMGGGDQITGAGGRDLLIGGQGSDALFGGAGADDILGGHFIDIARQDVPTLALADGDNVIDAGAGDDVVLAAHGLIQISATGFDARLRDAGGSAAADPTGRLARRILSYADPQATAGRYGASIVAGGAGNDMLFGGAGNDLLLGDQTLVFAAGGTLDPKVGANPSVLTGRAAYDYLLATKSTAWTSVRSATTTGAQSLMQRSVEGGKEWLFASVAAADGGAGELVIVRMGAGGLPATPGADYIEGGAGDDVLIAGAGASDLIGGSSKTFGAQISSTTAAKPAARLAGADIMMSGNADLQTAPATGSALLSGNGDIWKIVNGNQFATAGSVSGVAQAIIKRAIEIAETEPDPAMISRLFSASKGDYVVATQVGDRTYGDQSSGRLGANGAGQSTVVTSRKVDLTQLVNVIDRSGPQISAVGFDAAAVAVAPSAAKNASSNATGPLYLYSAATGGFTSATPTKRPVTAGANGVTDVATTSTAGTGYFYVDDTGAVWFYGSVPVSGGGGGTGGGTGGGGTGGGTGGGGTGGGGGTVDPNIVAVGMSGKFTITPAEVGKAVRVEFGATITNAVVALTGTQSNGDPYTLRIVDRDTTGFSVILDEWEYQDNTRSASETINWMAVQAGVYQLADGRMLEAGTMVTDAKGANLAFTAKFAGTPVLLTSVMSNYRPEAVHSRLASVSATGANVVLETEKARAGQSGKELVGYIAISQGAGVQLIADGVDSTKRSFKVSGTFSNMVVLAQEQSSKETDPAIAKIAGATGSTVQLFLEEDQSVTLDSSHKKENLGVIGLQAGTVSGARKGDAAYVPKSVLDLLSAANPTDAPVVGSAGSISVAAASVGKAIRIEFGSRIENAVVVLTGTAAPSDDPYTLRVLTRDATGFTFMVKEWEYQDGTRTAAVTVNWLAMSAGVYTMSDGRVIEAGTMLADKTAGAVRFSTDFLDPPAVITSVMSAIDRTAVDSSPISVTKTGFEARLQSEEARMDFDRSQELVGYVAFGAATNVGFLTTASHFGSLASFDTPLSKPVVVADTQTRKDADPQSAMIWSVAPKTVNLFIREETSLNADSKRTPLDTIGFAAVEAGLMRGTKTGTAAFVTAEQMAAATATGAALVAQQTAVIGVSGKVTVAPAQVGVAVRVAFGTTIQNAVVVLTGTTISASDPYTLRVLSRDATGFTFMVDEWLYQDGKRSTSVTVNWVAVAAGVHRLSDGRLVEAGTLLADQTSGNVAFTAGFTNGPAVLTSVMSSIDGTAVDSSPISVTADGFAARLQTEDARSAIPRSKELVGYIAFGIGGVTIRTIEATESARTTQFGRTFKNAVVVADSQTQRDPDAQTVMLSSLSTSSATAFIAEEASVSADVSRSQADTVAMAVFEAGALLGQKLGAATLVTDAQLAAVKNAPAYLAIGQSGTVSVTAAQAASPIRVTYRSPIDNAVVMLTGSFTNGDPYTLRVIARDRTGFTFVIEEWAYQNKKRAKTETIQWVAVASGSYDLADGRKMQVGTVDANTTPKSVSFGSDFTAPPVVVTTTMTRNDAKPTDSSPTAITKNGFSVALQVEQKGVTTHGTETVGYFAMSAGGSAQTGLSTLLNVSSTASTWTPPKGIGPMVVVADTQTRNKAATVAVKLTGVSSSGVNLILEPEVSGGMSVAHPAETVGLIAFLQGLIYGRKL